MSIFRNWTIFLERREYGMVWYGMDTCYIASAPCVIQLHMSVKSRWKLFNGQGLEIGK